MKKLMFAMVAGVAATVATAAPITQSGFESTEFASGATVGETDTYNTKFYYDSVNSSENTSTVKTYGGDNATAMDFSESHSWNYRNNEFVDAGSQYLDLSTDGGTLYRTINSRAENNLLGDPETVTSELYIDTLVQFTVCDAEPEIDSNAKLAIWLQASEDETKTNLMVKAKQWALTREGSVLTPSVSDTTEKVYTINSPYGVDSGYKAGRWYRLTVKDLGNVFTTESGYCATGFKIYIDGQEARSAQGSAIVMSGGTIDYFVADSGVAGDLTSNGAIFMSLKDDSIQTSTPTLCAVGFSGTGAVDNIFFTTENPFWTAPSTLDFTLTLAEGVSSLKYAVNGGDPVTVNTSTNFKADFSATITISDVVTPSSNWWTSNTYAIAEGENASVVGNTITLTNEIAYLGSDAAGATVSATPVAVSDYPAYLRSLGLNSALAEKFNDATKFNNLVTWLAAAKSANEGAGWEPGGYTVERLNNYEFAYERSQYRDGEDVNYPDGYPIAVNLYVSTNADVAAYTASVAGAAYTDESSVSGMKYVVDAGCDLSLTAFEFVAAPAGYKYLLDGDDSAAGWNYDASQSLVAENIDAIVVGAASNSVTFTVAVEASDFAQVGIATVEVSAAAPTYDFTVTFGENISSVSYTINGSGGGTLNASGTIPGGLNANDVLVLTPASSLALPMFYTNSVAPVYASTFSWTCDGAAGAMTLYAADASSASGSEAEAAATNAVAEAAAKAGADGAAVAANVDAAAKSEGVNVAKVASWLETKVAASKVSYAAVAAADSDDVAAAVGFDLDTLVADPKVEITAVEETTVEDADAYTLSFQVKDGQDPVAVGAYVANYVKSLVKMSSSLESWSELEKTVTVQKVGGVMKATVKPASPQTSAFMKIGE